MEVEIRTPIDSAQISGMSPNNNPNNAWAFGPVSLSVGNGWVWTGNRYIDGSPFNINL